jgi:hypothetical protein
MVSGNNRNNHGHEAADPFPFVPEPGGSVEGLADSCQE